MTKRFLSIFVVLGMIAGMAHSSFSSRIKTVKIGNQVWMAENVNTPIEGSWCYDNQTNNCKKYGRLYKWEDAMNICPKGFRLPTDDEWKQLEIELGMTPGQTDGVKARGTNADKLKSNSAGFNALMGGYFFNEDQKFHNLGIAATFWTSTEADDGGAWHRDINLKSPKIWRSSVHKDVGCSVRCIKDAGSK